MHRNQVLLAPKAASRRQNSESSFSHLHIGCDVYGDQNPKVQANYVLAEWYATQFNQCFVGIWVQVIAVRQSEESFMSSASAQHEWEVG